MSENITLLETALGYTFSDKALIRRALTHPSIGADNNQRLEFLGDAVLELCVSIRLYRELPDAPEGELTHQRILRVCEEALERAARQLQLNDFLVMEPGVARAGTRSLSGALADAVEALLAAVYLDGGMKAAARMIDSLWLALAPSGEPDHKSLLQEFTQRGGGETPTYETVAEDGPPHDRTFTAEVRLGSRVLARGTGTSKKRAEQQAACRALEALKATPNDKEPPHPICD